MSNQAEVQRRYRQRLADKRARMATALRTIITHTDGKTGPTAMEIRKAALEALGETE